MLALMLMACSLVPGPHTALEQAQTAFAQHDLAAFEAAVDLDAVAPAAFQVCFAGATRKGALEREFTGSNVLKDLVPTLGEAFALAAAQQGGAQIAEQVRKDFATLDLNERCPDVHFGTPSKSALFTARRSGSLMMPATIAGIPVEIPMKFAETNGQWRLVSMDVTDTLATLDAALAAEAHERALLLLTRVKKGGDPESWAGLRHYTARHPEDPEVLRDFDAAAAPLIAAKTPVALVKSDFAQSGVLGMKRQLTASVRNDSGKAAAKFTVRFQLLDNQGKPVEATTGGDSALGEGGPLAAGDSADVQVVLHALNFPGVAQTTAAVTRVTYEDGSSWTHPAIEAGLW